MAYPPLAGNRAGGKVDAAKYSDVPVHGEGTGLAAGELGGEDEADAARSETNKTNAERCFSQQHTQFPTTRLVVTQPT